MTVPLVIRISLTVLFLQLSGCSSWQRIDRVDDAIVNNENKSAEYINSFQVGAVIKEDDSQWINPKPISVTADSRNAHNLPPCSLTLNHPGEMPLQAVAAFISQQCNIPVFITDDANIKLNNTRPVSDDRSPLSGPLPVPDPSASGTSSVASATSEGSTAGGVLRGLYWQGDRVGLLNHVTGQLGLGWKYQNSQVTIFYINTETFPVLFMDSNARFYARTVSGTTSSGDSQEQSSSTLSSRNDNDKKSDGSTSQSTAVEIKSSIYKDISSTVGMMLTPQMGRMNLTDGVLTVTDTPQVLSEVRRYLDDRNAQLNRQVVLNVQVFSVDKRKNDQLGIDWNAVFKDSQLGLSLTSPFSNAASEMMSGGISIIDGKGKGSTAFLKALSSQANISVLTQVSSMTTNLSAVPIQVALQQDYASNASTENTANVGSSSSISKSTITTGFNMTVLPYLMPDSTKMQLQFAINMSDDPTIRTFTSQSASVELTRTRLKTFTQRVIMQSGQTLVLSGYQSLNDTANHQGVGNARFFGLGGGGDGSQDKTVLVILITPMLMG